MNDLFKGYSSDQLGELLSMETRLDKNLQLAIEYEDVEAITFFRNQLFKVAEMIAEALLAIRN